MKIEEAILYCLTSQNRGMRTEQIAELINRQRLHIRKDGQPVTSKQVYGQGLLLIETIPKLFRIWIKSGN